MLPFCKKLETYHPNDPAIDQSLHGHDGPIHISDGGYRGKSENQFMETAKKLGHKEIVDLQDFEQCGGFSVSTYQAFDYKYILTKVEMATIRLT